MNAVAHPPEHSWYLAYLGLGSNINPSRNLIHAMNILRQLTRVESVSGVWETPPSEAQGPNYLNAAVLIHTNLTPTLLKTLVLRRIEVQLGRDRSRHKNAPRPIDVDILMYDDRVFDPKIWTHAFVAVPLAELLPELQHPTTRKKLSEVATLFAKTAKLFPRPDVSLK